MTGSFRCCGVRVDGIGPENAVRTLLESRYGVARGAHLCNSYTLALALRDPNYREDLNAGHLNFADGRRSAWEVYEAVAAEALSAGEWYYGRVTPQDVQAALDAAAAKGAFTVRKR